MKVNKLSVAGIFLLFALFSAEISYPQIAVSIKNLKHDYSINLPGKYAISELPSKEECDTLIAEGNEGGRLEIIVKNDKIYKGLTANQLSHRSFMPDLKIKFKNVKLAENDYTDISGIPALYMKVEYRNAIAEEGFITQYIMLRGEKVFIIRIYAPKESYDNFINEISGYIFSFRFIDESNKGLYVNAKYNFMITFPQGWMYDKLSFPVQANNSKGSSIFIDIIRNKDFENITSRDLDIDLLMTAFKEKFTDIVLVSRKNTEIDGNPALYAKYKWKQANTGKNEFYYVHHYYIIRNGILYVIQGIISDKYTEKEETQMLNSMETFEFTK